MFFPRVNPQRKWAKKVASWTEKSQRSLLNAFYGLEESSSSRLTASGFSKEAMHVALSNALLNFQLLEKAPKVASFRRLPSGHLCRDLTARLGHQMPQCLARKRRLQGSLGSVNKRIARLADIQESLEKKNTAYWHGNYFL